jgi:hypothetical protein
MPGLVKKSQSSGIYEGATSMSECIAKTIYVAVCWALPIASVDIVTSVHIQP